MGFADRRDAGRQLAASLAARVVAPTPILALPRGGVPVALEVARAFAVPLDVLGARKLGAPANPERAVGAIAEGGVAVLDQHAASRCGVTQEGLDEMVRRERGELARQVALYRAGRPAQDATGAVAVIVDDGLATGLTALAAVRAARARGAASVILAVPVGAPQAVAMLSEEADEVVCHTVPRRLRAVGGFYGDFSPVSDEEVASCLREAATELEVAR
jgi:predicted phosphoribosyltransferase